MNFFKKKKINTLLNWSTPSQMKLSSTHILYMITNKYNYCGRSNKTRGLKVDPRKQRYSQATKLGPDESGEARNRMMDIQKLCNNLKPVYKNSRKVTKILGKVAHLELKVFQC